MLLVNILEQFDCSKFPEPEIISPVKICVSKMSLLTLPTDMQIVIYGYVTSLKDLRSLRAVCRMIHDLLPECVTHVMDDYDENFANISASAISWLSSCLHLRYLNFDIDDLSETVGVESFLLLARLPLKRILPLPCEFIIPFMLAYRQTHGIVGKMSCLEFNTDEQHNRNTWSPGAPSFDGRTLICQPSYPEAIESISSAGEALLDMIDFKYILYGDCLRCRFYQRLFDPKFRPIVRGTLFTGSVDEKYQQRNFRLFLLGRHDDELHITTVSGVYQYRQLHMRITCWVTELFQLIPICYLQAAIATYPLIDRFIVDLTINKKGGLSAARRKIDETMNKFRRVKLIVVKLTIAPIEDSDTIAAIREEILHDRADPFDRVRFTNRSYSFDETFQTAREAYQR